MIRSSLLIQPDDIAGHYDDLDLYYRHIWGEHLHHGLWLSGQETTAQAIEQLITYVADTLPINAGQQVADVGCGYGGTSRYLARHRQWHMTGLTLSPKQFDYATTQSAGATNLRFLLRDWIYNGLDAGAFDGLVSIECVAHVADKQRYFDEIHRVLKPGGRAAITAWLTAEQTSGMAERWLLEPICREGRLPSMGTPNEYRQAAEQAGLRVLTYEDLTRHVQKTWRICLGRVISILLFSPMGWRFLLQTKSRHAVFIFTVARIMLAYAIGAMQYGFFVLAKPA